MRLRRDEVAVLGAAGFILAVSAAWWAFALWPVPGETPAWLARARAVCFGAAESGLPDAGGWLLLAGEPLGMLAVLAVGWWSTLRRALATLWSGIPGRAGLAAVALCVAVGLGLAAERVVAATGVRDAPADALAPWISPPLDRPAPSLALVDADGRRTNLDRWRGRPVLVTFAFGNCETVCPVVVERALRAREAAPEADAALVVITLDPWRDTPARLPHLARTWGLPPSPDGAVLGGEPAEVEAALDAWDVARRRDPLTGDIVHPALVYVIDRRGRIAHATSGGVEVLAGLLRSLDGGAS